MVPEVRDGPNHLVTNGAAYAEVVPPTQRAQHQESSSATCAIVDNATPAVSKVTYMSII